MMPTLSGFIPELVRKEALRIAQRYGFITADDLHEVEILQGIIEKRVFGAVLKGLAKEGLLRPTHYVSSKRKRCHGRPIIIFRYIGGAT